MRYYVYFEADGKLQSVNTVSYIDTLPPGLAEKAIEGDGTWNEATLSLDPIAQRQILPDELYRRFTDLQRYEFHNSDQVKRVKDAFLTYSVLKRLIWLDHPAFDTLFLDDLVAATDIPSFTAADKAKVKE